MPTEAGQMLSQLRPVEKHGEGGMGLVPVTGAIHDLRESSPAAPATSSGEASSGQAIRFLDGSAELLRLAPAG